MGIWKAFKRALGMDQGYQILVKIRIAEKHVDGILVDEQWAWMTAGAPRPTLGQARAAAQAIREMPAGKNAELQIVYNGWPLVIVKPGDPPLVSFEPQQKQR